jgi:excisionase family DNA binding protein
MPAAEQPLEDAHVLLATKLWLPITTTAEALGVTKPSIYKLVRDNELEYRRLGQRSYITTESIRRFLAKPSEIREPPEKLKKTRPRQIRPRRRRAS